jgi:AcrR family transcriptional regulator
MTIYIEVKYASPVARVSDTRTRLLEAGARLLRRQGYAGTGLKQIVDEGGAPWGSLYHFFPGGKQQLGTDVVEWSGERYRRIIESVLGAGDPVASVRAMFDLSARALESSDYCDGCPVATVALESASTVEGLRRACALVFESWLSTMEAVLVGAGMDGVAARELSLVGLSAFEGAIVLSRTLRSTRPLAVSGAAVAGLVAEALAHRRPADSSPLARGATPGDAGADGSG